MCSRFVNGSSTPRCSRHPNRWVHYAVTRPQQTQTAIERTRRRGAMTTKIVLDDADIPSSWYNILADMPHPPQPPLHPATQQAVGPDDLAPLFAMDLIKQEVSRERFIAIPDAVRAIYSLWRPTPLYRAHRLERALGTPAQIYYKYEGVSPAGSHKPNTAVAQAYYAQKAGTRRLTTETGAGQWGSGLALPYVRDTIAGKDVRIGAVEPSACPSLTRGVFAYDHGDTGGLTPLMPMHTLGHTFVPAGIHAGGLRYHGMSPIVSQLYNDGLIEARAYPQLDVFDAAVRFARSEAILPAPEAGHALQAVSGAALRCKEEGKQETILFNLSGHGNFDMAAYDAHVAGRLEDFTLPQEEIQRALRDI